LIVVTNLVDSENNPAVMSTVLNLRPGTHHIKYIVDGDMRASDNLPTAVDFTNHLVNYIEISADDVNRSRRESEKGAVPPGIHPPQVIPEQAGAGKDESAVDEDKEDKEEPEEPEEIPTGDFRSIIPPFLLDLDKDEDSASYQQAVNIIGDAPTPPSLPLFLGKSILNGTTPMKDDSSLLNNPNHTVLNHLATSSIKNGVLATSVTTRYKRKVSSPLSRTLPWNQSANPAAHSMSRQFCINLPGISANKQMLHQTHFPGSSAALRPGSLKRQLFPADLSIHGIRSMIICAS
jgi:hypothetical protein